MPRWLTDSEAYLSLNGNARAAYIEFGLVYNGFNNGWIQGFESAALVINTGAIAGAGDFTAKLQESDEAAGGTFTDVAADHLVGAFPATLEANSVVKVGYIGHRRYVRTVITRNSGTSIAIGAVLVKGHPHVRPVA